MALFFGRAYRYKNKGTPKLCDVSKQPSIVELNKIKYI
jgi:hypothetical protein